MINKKEKITLKTIFFVSVIVLFVVSLSTTNIQLAEAVTREVILEKIQEIKDRTNLKESMSADELKEKQELFQRLSLAKELVTLQARGLGESQEAAEAMQQIRDAFTEYPPIIVEDFPHPSGIKEFGTEQLLPLQQPISIEPTENLAIGNNMPTITTPAYIYRSYDVSDVSRTSCNTIQIGSSHGSITAYSTYSYVRGNLVGPQDHPTIIWDECQPKTFDNGVIFYYNFEEPWNSCTQHFDSVHHTRGGICSGITSNHLVLIDVEANYQGTEFSSIHGTQWIVL
ncbi:hypothetical protein [Nitrosopumilus sp.]|uniref:hypothetical protein n=1 Tax=Nitrosopumilus sp. TaxID=2024843 RepID=UPI0029319A7E|nr:hypothetical protein [Nitrosopumilus sp.]